MKRIVMRFATWYVIGYLAVVAAFAYAINEVHHEAQVREQRLCEIGNTFREGLIKLEKEKDQVLVAASRASAAEESNSPADLERRERSIQRYLMLLEPLYEPLEPRDCDVP